MANYTVIGGDGKPYGPITEVELRKWIAEGRLNGQSFAKGEGDAEFRALSIFPELADVFAPAALPPGIAPVLAGGTDSKAASDKVRVPAIGLMVSAVISALFAAWNLISILFFAPNLQQYSAIFQQMNNPQFENLMEKMMHFAYGPVGIATDAFQILIAILIFTGALKMLNLRSYEFAFSAALLSVIPCISPCCGWIFGLIFGIWAMAVLGKAKPHFS
jgi:GYF domain 2